MPVSWLRGLICSTVLISGIGCEEKTHVVGALADGSTGSEDASAGSEEDASTGIPAECSNLPPCVLRLIAACRPSGTCVLQDLSGFANRVCYSNGVEFVLVVTSTSITETASKNGSTCWVLASRVYGVDAAPTWVQVLEDGSGIQVAEVWQNEQALPVVTCTEDGSSTVINQACDLSKVFFGDQSTCVPGTCPS